VSASLFDVLGVAPTIGRGFRQGEDRATAPKVAILSHALWQGRFHGDAQIVGKTIVVDGVSRQIVGVMPRGFAYPSAEAELWLPLAWTPRPRMPGASTIVASRD
jgi:hypothetical protein